MKKQDLINLVKYHMFNNNSAFLSEVAQIAKGFDAEGDSITASALMELISSTDYYIPQAVNYSNLTFLNKVDYSNKTLLLPDAIEEDILGIVRAINKSSGMTKYLFYGAPGTGKTESAYQIARMLHRDILSVDFSTLVSRFLGETSKNISLLFEEINHLPFSNVLVLFDEIDAIVMDRVNTNDLREMGRVTSQFIKCLDSMNENVVLIATTNLFPNFDKALTRRFDAIVSFDRYSDDDLVTIADVLLANSLKKDVHSKRDMRLFNKILNSSDSIPLPGDLKQMINSSVAFSDEAFDYDYLRKIYLSLHDGVTPSIQELNSSGFTTREIEVLTHIPKSSISRKLKG